MAPRLRRSGVVLDARAAGGARELPASEPIERDLGPATAVVWALCESTFKGACVMDWRGWR